MTIFHSYTFLSSALTTIVDAVAATATPAVFRNFLLFMPILAIDNKTTYKIYNFIMLVNESAEKLSTILRLSLALLFSFNFFDSTKKQNWDKTQDHVSNTVTALLLSRGIALICRQHKFTRKKITHFTYPKS